MPKLALVGYGKMGRLLEQLAPAYGLETVLRLDEFNNAGGSAITEENFRGVDAAIEFSTPHAVIANLERLTALGIPTVVGTTGWHADRERIRSLVESAGTAMVHSPNFSIGVNVFFRLVEEATRLLARQPAYGAWAWEIHHHTKKDAPSGTLLELVSRMRDAGYQGAIDVSSNRAGAHPGTHEIGFDSPADTITLRHAARNREGFARGALHAAQWLTAAPRKGFFDFRDILFA